MYNTYVRRVLGFWGYGVDVFGGGLEVDLEKIAKVGFLGWDWDLGVLWVWVGFGVYFGGC